MTKRELKALKEKYQKELKSGKVVNHKNKYELFINKYGGYICVINLKTDKEIFAK